MTLSYLFWAYNVIWISLAVYLWSIASRQASVRRELDSLRAVLEEQKAKSEK